MSYPVLWHSVLFAHQRIRRGFACIGCNEKCRIDEAKGDEFVCAGRRGDLSDGVFLQNRGEIRKQEVL